MTAPPPPLTVRVFTQRFSSTPLGARLARHLVLAQLHTWGVPHDSEGSDTVAVIVAELTANAVTHGRVPGRDFELRLALIQRTVRIEVSDTRGERRPPEPGAVTAPPPDADHGRGLLLVEALAHRWTVLDRVPIGKTVRAELDLTPASRPVAPPTAPATP
jgi:anti-sigma regulatory factor (Ser/Thr protein kinase)